MQTITILVGVLSYLGKIYFFMTPVYYHLLQLLKLLQFTPFPSGNFL
jgi:hypothetical protein